jgi:hypothetical protein
MALRFTACFILIISAFSPALGQGFLDSTLGSGGLGLWGNTTQQSVLNTFNSPQFYGAPMARPGNWTAPGYQDQGGQAQNSYQATTPPPATNYYHPNVYSSGRGLYPDWYDVGPSGYPNNQTNTQGAVNQEYQTHGAVPNQAPQQAQGPTPPQSPNAGARPAAAQPTQNTNQRPDLTNNPEKLPPGAVKIITSTPEGTTVQYYTPPGGAPPSSGATTAPPNTAPQRPSAGNFRPSGQGAQTEAPKASNARRVARPSPTNIPSNHDPRRAWGAAVKESQGQNPFRR